jgi:hypothetical protein
MLAAYKHTLQAGWQHCRPRSPSSTHAGMQRRSMGPSTAGSCRTVHPLWLQLPLLAASAQHTHATQRRLFRPQGAGPSPTGRTQQLSHHGCWEPEAKPHTIERGQAQRRFCPFVSGLSACCSQARGAMLRLPEGWHMVVAGCLRLFLASC